MKYYKILENIYIENILSVLTMCLIVINLEEWHSEV